MADKMNVNSPVFVPHNMLQKVSARAWIAAYDCSMLEQQQRARQYGLPAGENGGCGCGGITYYQPVQWVVSQIYSYSNFGALQNNKQNDTMQRHGSKGCHQRDSSISSKNEAGSGIVNGDFAIHHNQQKQSTNKSAKSQHQNRGTSGGINKRNDNKHSHPWLVSSLKGHTDEIRDIDFSSNGKYLASCAEDNIIGSHNARHRNSATSDLTGSDDINSSSSNEDISSATYAKQSKKSSKNGRNRRQRKNQHYTMDIDDETKENQQPQSKGLSSNNIRKQGKLPTSPLAAANNTSKQQGGATFVNIDNFAKIARAVTPPLRQHTKLNLQESDLAKFLRYYLVDVNLLKIYGYPMESTKFNGCVEILKCSPRPFPLMPASRSGNKRHGCIKWNDSGIDVNQLSGDSGQGSGSSSPPSVDSDTSDGSEEETSATQYNPDGSYQIYTAHQYNQESLGKRCVRCKRTFLVTSQGEYLTREECTYHWGKLNQVYNGTQGLFHQYTCCNRDQLSEGCSRNRLHVWSGISVGINGPYCDFIKTEHKPGSDKQETGLVYALDCEMCFTGLGLELTKVTMVGADGQMVYENFVRTKSEIVDYNTRFSGITEKDLSIKNNNVKTFEEVQKDLLQLISADTLLIGHALDNDLRVLKILHTNIIDTSITFPHVSGFPFRRALKTLTKIYLNRDIQNGDGGHSSFEDSRACLELMLWRVRKDFRLVLEQ